MDVQAVWDDRRSRITVSGQDIYGITAPIVVEACLRVLEDPPATGGAFAPGELYAASCFLAALAPHLEITVSHGARSRSACLDSGIHPRQT
jgi:hypothetical protein